ncbi:hypothetical protein BUALT_Bualt07G0083500 [Buddleja alternifolia]|uniref:Uncharacterized protein n=1 Tax=Buddleja alternifolia TaxID=168488 RepID=A0AAV6XAH7_9LAMI|nr:hypothetical protein BUALT_Bualt07G0083500 [Buddleja alternifolia]
MVKVLVANEGTVSEENSTDKFEEDGEWILVMRRRRQRRCIDELHPLFLKKSYSPTVGKPNPMKVLKTPHVNFKKSSKSNHRTPVTLDDFFPKKFRRYCHLRFRLEAMWGENQAKSVVVEHIPQSGCDFSNPLGPGKLEPELTGEKIHGLTKAQHKLRKQGYQVDQPKTGLGFALAEPVRIRVTKKEKCVDVQHISIEGDEKGKKPSDDRVSVFDRLSTRTARPSVFGRLSSSSRIPNVQDRFGASSIPQSSIFNRLGGGSTQQLKKRNHAGETDTAGSRNNNQTLILSQPQGSKSSLVLITMDGTVKVKQRIISNSRRSNENNPNEDEVEVIISSNYAAVDEDSDPEASNDEIQEAPPQLEDGGHATVDELKELNLGTKDEPRPIFGWAAQPAGPVAATVTGRS